ncbi:hypothetical protein L226DRAFT_527671 [Lentinus tigrinus ALCF2SS1-7]|uniref:uncharacterized protein n=1 Tax=Lentinus tigrinus ALCF2SS1-7 TaxID=1328758 RepID=UPI001165E812|nr:hypothetical protein L226DRAFT_527671 [Lentinus tigrinus ALCF2SS1-7]
MDGLHKNFLGFEPLNSSNTINWPTSHQVKVGLIIQNEYEHKQKKMREYTGGSLPVTARRAWDREDKVRWEAKDNQMNIELKWEYAHKQWATWCPEAEQCAEWEHNIEGLGGGGDDGDIVAGTSGDAQGRDSGEYTGEGEVTYLGEFICDVLIKDGQHLGAEGVVDGVCKLCIQCKSLLMAQISNVTEFNADGRWLLTRGAFVQESGVGSWQCWLHSVKFEDSRA